jgi:hypothetical protein
MDEKTPVETFRTVMQETDEDENRACYVAFEALRGVTGASPAVVQRMLDGAPGVVLARAVVEMVDEGEMTLREAVQEVVRRQSQWSFGHDAAKAHGVDPQAPYFVGWAEVVGRDLPPGQGKPRGDVTSDEDLPPGVAEAFYRIADYGFVRTIWPVVGKVEVVVVGLTAAVVVAEEADVSGEAVDAFLRDPATGRAFGAAILSHLALDPERRVERALLAAIRDWKRLELPPAIAAHFGAEPGMSRLRALARWHEREDGGPEGE